MMGMPMMIMFMIVRVIMVMFMVVFMFMVMMVIMFVFVLMAVIMYIQRFLFLSVHGHFHMGPGDSALDGGLSFHLNPRKPQGVYPVQESLTVGTKFQQGGGQHISGRAHAAFQIECFHI